MQMEAGPATPVEPVEPVGPVGPAETTAPEISADIAVTGSAGRLAIAAETARVAAWLAWLQKHAVGGIGADGNVLAIVEDPSGTAHTFTLARLVSSLVSSTGCRRAGAENWSCESAPGDGAPPRGEGTGAGKGGPGPGASTHGGGAPASEPRGCGGTGGKSAAHTRQLINNRTIPNSQSHLRD